MGLFRLILSGKGYMTLIMVRETQTKFESETSGEVGVKFFLCEWLWVIHLFLYLCC